MFIAEKHYTLEEYLTLAEANQDKRLEWVQGELVELAPSSKQNTVIASLIVYHLTGYNLAHQVGYVTGADGGYQLGDEQVRLPDAAFISHARAGGLMGHVFPTAPDLAVEVVSPSESAGAVQGKVRAYLQAGTKQVWTVYPDEKLVDVYQLNEAGEIRFETVIHEGTLDGGEVLPGFRLPVSAIFPA